MHHFKSSRFPLENFPVKCNGNTIEEELTDSDVFRVSFDVCDLLSFSLGLLQFGFQRKDANPAVDFHVKHRKKVLLVCLHVCFTGRALFQSLNDCLRASRYLYLTGHAKESEGRSRDCFNFFLLRFPRLFGLDFFWLKKTYAFIGDTESSSLFLFQSLLTVLADFTAVSITRSNSDLCERGSFLTGRRSKLIT